MKTPRRFFTALLLATPALLSAHPGHDDGHELTWDFHGHGLWDSALTFLIIALAATTLLLARFARRLR